MVSWVFLAVAIWGAGWTLISFRPPRHPPLLMGMGFFAAWSTTELAPVHLVLQFIATIVFVFVGRRARDVGRLDRARDHAGIVGRTRRECEGLTRRRRRRQAKALAPVMSRPTMRVWMVSVPL